MLGFYSICSCSREQKEMGEKERLYCYGSGRLGGEVEEDEGMGIMVNSDIIF